MNITLVVYLIIEICQNAVIFDRLVALNILWVLHSIILSTTVSGSMKHKSYDMSVKDS